MVKVLRVAPQEGRRARSCRVTQSARHVFRRTVRGCASTDERRCVFPFPGLSSELARNGEIVESCAYGKRRELPLSECCPDLLRRRRLRPSCSLMATSRREARGSGPCRGLAQKAPQPRPYPDEKVRGAGRHRGIPGGLERPGGPPWRRASRCAGLLGVHAPHPGIFPGAVQAWRCEFPPGAAACLRRAASDALHGGGWDIRAIRRFDHAQDDGGLRRGGDPGAFEVFA